jgi:hypothetical protein
VVRRRLALLVLTVAGLGAVTAVATPLRLGESWARDRCDTFWRPPYDRIEIDPRLVPPGYDCVYFFRGREMERRG